ncbi:MAG: fumarylacetoacetate hydrolase family protein, partial [Thermoleophilaceae bacterium]
MRLVSYDAGDGPRAGVVRADSVVDVGRSVLELLRSGALDAGLSPDGEGRPLGDVRLLPPVLGPEKIVCIGLNYRSHAEEQGAEPPETPTIFAKFRNALAPPDSEVKLPGYSSKVDYEAEVAFVI